MISVFARPSRHYSDSPQFDTLERRPTTNDRATPKQRDPKRDQTMEDTNSKKFIRFQGIYCAFPEIVDRSTQEAIPSKTGYVDRLPLKNWEGMTTHNGIRYIARTNIVIHPFVLWSLSFYIYRSGWYLFWTAETTTLDRDIWAINRFNCYFDGRCEWNANYKNGFYGEKYNN